MAEPKFEKDLERLEAIVEALEGGGLALDEALKTFEEGIGLAKRCEQALAQAEKRIEVLTANADGELEATAFDPDAAEEPSAKKPKRAAKKAPEPEEPADREGERTREPEPQEPADGDELF